MTDTDEVAPQEETAEESDSLIDIASILEASGVSENSFIDNASEPEEVAEEEVKEEVEETEEVVSEEPTEQKPDDSDGVKKRIGKLVEAKNTALAEVEELKAELESLKGGTQEIQKPTQKGLDKFEDVKTLEELQKREQNAEHLREWLLENPDGGEYKDLAGEEHEVDYDQARQLTVETDRDLRKNIPVVANRIVVEKNKQNQIAVQTFKWLADPSSPEQQEVKAILSNNSDLKKYVETDPHGLITLGYAVEGFKAVRAAAAKARW